MVCTIEVRSYELDSFGHVNNAVYLNYLETARSLWFPEIGLSFDDIAAEGIQIVIAEANIRYLAPARFGDRIRIEGGIDSVGPASLIWRYRLVRERDGVELATASTTGVCIDPITGKPRRWPERFRGAYALLTPD
ncbi:MAG: acyl-CoA thioesterase [Armatimonadota bacterium]